MTVAWAALTATVATAASFRFLHFPLSWSLGAWAVVCFVAIPAARRNWRQALFLYGGVALLVVAIFDVWLGWSPSSSRRRDVVVDPDGRQVARYHPHPLLGYAPAPGIYHWQRFVGEDLLFDVRYEIDSLGLRASPETANKGVADCVLFFGGSFTFGPGMQDSETFAYRVGSRNPDLRVYNFSYTGYGTHQMLALFEHGLVQEKLRCRDVRAVYLAIPDHARRLAGKSSWDRSGPWYQLAQGRVVYRGSFRDQSWLWQQVVRQARKSPLVSLALLSASSDDLELMARATMRAEELIRLQFGGQLDVLVWDAPGDPTSDQLVQLLRSSGIRLHLVSNILPGGRSRYRLSDHDKHPNSLAHQLIADYVTAEILSRKVIDPPAASNDEDGGGPGALVGRRRASRRSTSSGTLLTVTKSIVVSQSRKKEQGGADHRGLRSLSVLLSIEAGRMPFQGFRSPADRTVHLDFSGIMSESAVL